MKNIQSRVFPQQKAMLEWKTMSLVKTHDATKTHNYISVSAERMFWYKHLSFYFKPFFQSETTPKHSYM